MLKISYLKRIFVVPPLVVLTLGFILLFCHWFISLQKKLLYSETDDLENATHVYVYASRKQIEIIKLDKEKPSKLKKSFKGEKYFKSVSDDTNESKFSFNFRFTKYIYCEPKDCFVPVEFDYYYKPYSSILSTYSSGICEGEKHATALSQYGR